MPKYAEIKTRPIYSYRAQKLVNSLPTWSSARQDKHSNYQSIISDLTNPMQDLTLSAKNILSRLSLVEADMTNSAKVSRFYAPTDDLPKVEKENFFYYKIPDRVYVVDSDPNVDEYELLKVKEREIKELNNRLPLQIKSIDNAVPTFEVISFNETTKEFCIFVKETCYLGITLSSEEDFAPENFFIKEKDEYIYSFAYVKNSLDTKLQGIKIFPEKHQMFIDPVSPGIHYVSFDLLESSQLDTFDIELYSNNSTSTPDKFLYYDNYIDENQNILSYMTISNDRLEVVRKDWQGLSGTLDKSMLLESYQMLDEENQ